MCDNGIVLVHSSVTARCKLSPAGYERMFRIRRSLNRLYNDSLEERKRAYQERKQKLSFYDQCKVLTKLRQTNEHGLGSIAVGPARGMLKRLDEAFKSFFRRVKVGQKPGYPRFRALARCVTIDVTSIRPSVLRDCGTYYAIRIKGFPKIQCYPSQTLPDSRQLQSLRLTLRGRHWHASMVYQLEQAAAEPATAATGIDVGVRKRMTLSNGKTYKPHKRNWKRMRKAQRAVARCKQGSQTRRKRVARLARYCRREFVSQRNALHRASTEIVRSYGLIAVERLKVVNLTRSAKGTEEAPGTNVNAKAGLNREVLAQDWSLLRSQLRYKAAWAGREYVEVDPKHTSQDCHRCGARNHPKRAETYRCAACGLAMDRDHNAAINILAAGVLAAGASTWAVTPCVAPEPYAGTSIREFGA